MRLFETNVNEAIHSPTSRNIEATISHCKMYNPFFDGAHIRSNSRKGMHLRYQQKSTYENTESEAAEVKDTVGGLGRG